MRRENEKNVVLGLFSAEKSQFFGGALLVNSVE